MKKYCFCCFIVVVILCCSCNQVSVETDSSSEQPKVTPFETHSSESETTIQTNVSVSIPENSQTTRYDEDYLAGLPADVLIDMFNITPDGLDYRFIDSDYPLEGVPDLVYDAGNNRIIGSYENISFDVSILTDEDNLPTVGVYREVEDDSDWFNYKGLLGWTGNCNIQVYRLLSGFVYIRFDGKEYIVDNSMTPDFVNSMEYVKVESNDELIKLYDSFSSQYGDIYPNVFHFRFNNDLLDSPACTTDYMRGFNTDVDTSDFYAFRREFNELPVTTSYPTGASSFISWDGNDYVGFVGDKNQIKYNYDLNMYADFIENHLIIKEVIEEGLAVIPIENCIENCISQIRYDTRYFNVSKVNVFAAELTYTSAAEFLQASVDEEGFVSGGQFAYYDGDFPEQNIEGVNGTVYFLFPTWSVYYTYVTPDGFTRVGTAFLSATTGEGLAIDNQVINESYLYSEVYEASFNKLDSCVMQPGEITD